MFALSPHTSTGVGNQMPYSSPLKISDMSVKGLTNSHVVGDFLRQRFHIKRV